MTWVNSCPKFLIPLSLSLPIVAVTPIPQTPLLAVVTSSTVVIYESTSLLPLALHKRTQECLQTHGPSVEAQARHVAVDTSKLHQLHSVNLYVRTNSNYVLIFHLFINYARSLYEVTDANDTDRTLQNSKPLASDSSRFNLTNLIKLATKTIIQGGAAGTNLTNLEHFNNAATDDDQRNENIPLVKLTMVKILKMNAGITGFWCKPSSQNLIFSNDCQEVQILNLKTFNNEIIKLLDFKWYYDTELIEYNSNYNFFLHLNTTNELAVLQFDHSSKDLTLSYTLLTKLDFKCRAIIFNPQFNLVIFQSDTDLRIYKMSLNAKHSTLTYLKTLHGISDPKTTFCKWSPCGTFLILWDTETGFWKIISKFGFCLFDSQSLAEEISTADIEPENLERVNGFCFISNCAISLNSQTLYLVNADSSKLFYVDLLRLQERYADLPIFYDNNYLSSPITEIKSFARFPILPMFQKILSRFHFVNGTALALSHRKPTGAFTIKTNDFQQLSISYGESIAVSTPIKLGTEFLQPLWYVFYNHVAEAMNIVDHFWVDDYLFTINRFAREDGDADDGHNLMVDELMVFNTLASKHGAGGVDFKFDSDSLVWRHSFKTRIVNFELVDNQTSKTLVLVTSDMKVILLSLSSKDESGEGRIAISILRTIHLSSMKHKISITSIQQIAMVDGKHFLFLLDTGEMFLLKNQSQETGEDTTNGKSITQMNNMYELIKICSVVESFQVSVINFNQTRHNRYVTFFNGNDVLIYNMNELVERTYEFVGVENSGEVDIEKPLLPIKVIIDTFMPLRVILSTGSIEVTGFEYQPTFKSGFLILKHKSSRQLILNKFIEHDLFESSLSVNEITQKYLNFSNYDYCLELLLFENLDNADQTNRIQKVCRLVDATGNSDSIYINFLRKIEVTYWNNFFDLLNQTPVGFMNRLIESKNVELCYNYLNVYLNFKREFEGSAAQAVSDEDGKILDNKDRALISRIIQMLLKELKWDECFELCRYIKLLEPSGELLREIREFV